MSQQTPNYNITNEHLLLIDIINGMYNDNLRQINSLTDTINSLNNTNTQIRNLLIQILYNPNSHNTASHNTASHTSARRNSNYRSISGNTRQQPPSIRGRYTERTGDRVIINNTPYIIESVQEYTLPLRPSGNIRNNNRNETFNQILEEFLQPIDIYPSQAQIEAATRNVRYSDIVSPINRSCPISLENFNDNDMVSVIRYCGHIFNRAELNTWFLTNCRCPVCRYDIRNYNSRLLRTDNRTNPENSRDEPTENSEVDDTMSNTMTNTSIINTNAPTQNTYPSSQSLYSTILNNLDNFTDTSNNYTNETTNAMALLTLLNTLNNTLNR